jgi:hypothetical protein
MKSLFDDDGDKPPTLGQRLSGAFLGTGGTSGTGRARPPRQATSSAPTSDPSEILSPGQRRAAMTSLDPVEVKFSRAGVILSAVLGVIFTLYLRSAHSDKIETVVRNGKKVREHVPISTDWLLLGAVIIVFCIIGGVSLQRRKRTLLVFSFFVIGFAFTLVFAPIGFAMIFLGGWLMLRAYRIQKFGTPNAKQAARQAATRPPRRERKRAAQAPPKPSGYKPPTANKRYTPKAPPRKKVAKPTE